MGPESLGLTVSSSARYTFKSSQREPRSGCVFVYPVEKRGQDDRLVIFAIRAIAKNS